MAGTDLFTGLIVQPMIVAVHVKKILGDGPFCDLDTVYVRQLLLMSSMTSLSHLVLIGIDRFIAVKKPLRYQAIETKRRIIIGMILAWAFSLYSRIQDLILSIIGSKQEENFYGKIQDVIISIFAILCIVVIAYMYGYICLETRRQKKRIKNEQLTQEARNVRRENKTTNAVTIILGVILLTYLPAIICTAVTAFSDHTGKPRVMAIVWAWADTFIMLGSLSNPLIYCWRFKKLRHAFLEMLRLREAENHPPAIEMAVIRRHRPEVPPTTTEAFFLPTVIQDPVLLSSRHLYPEEIVRAEENNPL